MKTVFTSHEIAHVWANKSAPYGKSPGAVSFDGPVIRSYATAIARHVEHKGKPAVIYNATSYSVSTSKHQSRIWQAIRHNEGMPVFRVSGLRRGEDLRLTGEELFAHYIQQAQQAEEDSRRPRIRPHTVEAHKARAASFLEQAREVATFYGLRRKVDEKAIQRLATAKARAEKREAIARAKREEAERVKQENAFKDWLANVQPEDVLCECANCSYRAKQGELPEARDTAERHESGDIFSNVECPKCGALCFPIEKREPSYFNPRLFPHAFRIEGEELVSTLGARIPIEDARKAVRFAKLMRERGWHRNGERFPVGMYQLDAINPQGVVAGCHRVTWEEVERVEAMLNAALQPV